MMATIYGWLAHMLPRRLVMACVMRAIGHCIEMDLHRGLTKLNAHTIMWEWRDVCDGTERERR